MAETEEYTDTPEHAAAKAEYIMWMRTAFVTLQEEGMPAPSWEQLIFLLRADEAFYRSIASGRIP